MSIALLIGTAILPSTGAANGVDEARIEAARVATAKYRDVNVALADGFIPDPAGKCITAKEEGLPAKLGGMGIHYLNPARLKITATEPRVNGMSTHTDFTKPAILLYEPQSDGSLKLVGLENLVFQAAWKSAGNKKPPEFSGHVWNTMADDASTNGDEAHQFMPHYDLHMWTERKNPGGNLSPFNPNVSC